MMANRGRAMEEIDERRERAGEPFQVIRRFDLIGDDLTRSIEGGDRIIGLMTRITGKGRRRELDRRMRCRANRRSLAGRLEVERLPEDEG